LQNMNDPGKAVFLSYASQDVEAARRIRNDLREAGIEVWFDQSELRGGDAWDTAIRNQIKACALFLPIISTNSSSRTEGYFRLEWKLAVDRSHLMAPNRAFLLPIIIDETKDARTNVPDRFREVQWISLPQGQPTPAFVERVVLLIARDGLVDDQQQEVTHNCAFVGRPIISPQRAKVLIRRRLWLIAVMTGVLMGATWIIIHERALPARMVPYSIEDRRMTFALLPLQSPAEDSVGTQIATATGNAVFSFLESDHIWVNLASRASVTRALAQSELPKDVAKILNVHFLIRGSVTPAPGGYAATLVIVDGETEHVLGSANLLIPRNALTPRWRDEIDNAVGRLIFYGLQNEVAQARDKPDSALDVRDLTFRALVSWGRERMANNEEGAYLAANALLKRALAQAPDDPLALSITAKVNLCDCVDAWSTNVAEQQAIGEGAIERYLSIHPDDPDMLHYKASLYQLRGRYEESLLVLDKVLTLQHENFDAMEDKARALLKMGRPKEAAALASSVYARHPDDWPGISALIAAIDYELADFANAERFAQKAATQFSKAQLGNPNFGAVRLTLIAAAAQVHDASVVAAGISDLNESVSGLTSLIHVRQWMHPQADLYGYEPLFDGLRLAGLHD
jgi:tetratricopeptide (TPR) repeat protein